MEMTRILMAFKHLPEKMYFNFSQMKVISFLFLFLISGSLYAQINVDRTKTYLEENGKPFFWLGDTGWELFHRLSREEVIHYLDVRQQQGFNVVMAVALAELDGINHPNYYGDIPFKNISTLEWDETPGNDTSNAEEYDYWDNVDFVINEAAKRNIHIGLLPSWGSNVVQRSDNQVIFSTPDKAYTYAKKIAERYINQKNIIWILGGDRPAIDNSIDYRPIWRGMAQALQEVYGKNVFIAYHPNWRTSEYFKAGDPWLSMNAIQSGHATRDVPVWHYVRADLETLPKRPYMDVEPCYEDHPVNPWDGKWTRKGRGYFSAYDVRARIYRGVFAGGCGAIYGHHQVWQFVDTTRSKPLFTGDTLIGWKKAIYAKGAFEMQYLKKLMLSHPDFHRVEDSLLIASYHGSDYKDIIIATRNQNKTYALIYLPQPITIKVNLNRLLKRQKQISWFNPSSGEETVLPRVYTNGVQTFTPPNKNQKDWVLVVEVR